MENSSNIMSEFFDTLVDINIKAIGLTVGKRLLALAQGRQIVTAVQKLNYLSN